MRAETAVTLQYPVVIFLILASVQLARPIGLRRAYVIAVGWAANFGYLVAHQHALTSRSNALAQYMADVLVLGSSLCFVLAARLPWPLQGNLRRIGREAGLGLILFFVAAFVGVADTVVNLAEKVIAPEIKLAHVLSDVLFHTYAIWSLSGYLRIAHERVAEREYTYPTEHGILRYGLLPYAALAYAVIQPLYLVAYWQPEGQRQTVEVAGFLLGLAAKSLLALGYIYLFLRITTHAIREKSKLQQHRSRLDEAKAVVGRINHEVGTPLAEIAVYIHALTENAPTHGRFREHLMLLDNAYRRVLAIMEAARSVTILLGDETSQIQNELRGTTPTRQITNLNTLVEAAVMSVKSTRPETMVSWRHQYSGGLCVDSIPSEVVQILVNVLRNAYDSFPDRRGVINIITAKQRMTDEGGDALHDREANARVYVEIRDNGEGVAPQVRTTMFEEGVTTRRGTARGYGLAVVKELAKRNKAVIEIKSPAFPENPEAPGTVVILSFPRVPCKSTRTHAAHVDDTSTAALDQSGGGHS